MIYECTFCNFCEKLNVGNFREPIYINPWNTLRENLQTEENTFVWIVTKEQCPGFMATIKEYGLMPYLIVRQDADGAGVENRNYKGDRDRLKVFVMKGRKENA